MEKVRDEASGNVARRKGQVMRESFLFFIGFTPWLIVLCSLPFLLPGEFKSIPWFLRIVFMFLFALGVSAWLFALYGLLSGGWQVH